MEALTPKHSSSSKNPSNLSSSRARGSPPVSTSLSPITLMHGFALPPTTRLATGLLSGTNRSLVHGAGQAYLGFQHLDSIYGFIDDGDSCKRLLWIFRRNGRSSNDDGSVSRRQTEEVVRKTQSFERLKMEAKKCLAQNEKITNDKIEFESFLSVEFKTREIRDKFSKQDVVGKLPEEEEVSSNQTEPYVSGDKNNEEEPFKDLPAISKDVPTTRS